MTDLSIAQPPHEQRVVELFDPLQRFDPASAFVDAEIARARAMRGSAAASTLERGLPALATNVVDLERWRSARTARFIADAVE